MAAPTAPPGSDEFHADVRHDRDATCVSLYGELDLATAIDAEYALVTAGADADPVIVDLSGLQFIDVTGVRLLLAAHERLGRRLTLLRGPSTVQHVLELTRAAGRLPFVD